jgi:LPXTG-site transpeptidase (sortase) family protein
MYPSSKQRLLILIQLLVLFALSPIALFLLIPIVIEKKPSSVEFMQSLQPTQSIQPKQLIQSIQKTPGLPVRLEIPKIGVNALFEHLGLTSQGVADTPKGPANVAWFNLGPRPGEKGSAVVTGHFGWWNKTPAVFDNLNKLTKGDRIYVIDNKGATTTFMVRDIQTYNESEEAFGVFNSIDNKSHLNLITCQGTWNSSQMRYSDRLVVFADKE